VKGGYGVMVDRSVGKAYVRLHRRTAKVELCGVDSTALDSKLARTFTDDVDIYHGLNTRRSQKVRPGQRDDESRCAYGKMVPAY
jgi:hypothetical protein